MALVICLSGGTLSLLPGNLLESEYPARPAQHNKGMQRTRNQQASFPQSTVRAAEAKPYVLLVDLCQMVKTNGNLEECDSRR